MTAFDLLERWKSIRYWDHHMNHGYYEIRCSLDEMGVIQGQFTDTFGPTSDHWWGEAVPNTPAWVWCREIGANRPYTHRIWVLLAKLNDYLPECL